MRSVIQKDPVNCIRSANKPSYPKGKKNMANIRVSWR